MLWPDTGDGIGPFLLPIVRVLRSGFALAVV